MRDTIYVNKTFFIWEVEETIKWTYKLKSNKISRGVVDCKTFSMKMNFASCTFSFCLFTFKKHLAIYRLKLGKTYFGQSEQNKSYAFCIKILISHENKTQSQRFCTNWYHIFIIIWILPISVSHWTIIFMNSIKHEYKIFFLLFLICKLIV